MDPLVCLLPEVHGWIFQHLTASNFREVSQVSPKWNENLENSPVMMKNVIVSLEDERFHTEDARKKNHLGKYDEVNKKLGSSCRRYRNVSVNFKYPFDKHELLKCLENSGSRLLKLEAYNLRDLIDDDEKLLDEIDLSKLEKLKLTNASIDLLDKVLNRCFSLTDLKMINIHFADPQATITCLPSFLEQNRNLEVMELNSTEICIVFFKEDISKRANFELKHLKLGNDSRTALPESIERNFFNFLHKQSQSLEYLWVAACRPKVIEFMFNKMPVLKILSIFSLFDTTKIALQLNENIIDLSIPLIEKCEDFQNMLQVVPNLKRLFTLYLRQEKRDIVINTLPRLEILDYLCADDGMHYGFFEQIAPPV